MPQADVRFVIRDERVKALAREAPGIMNSQMNRAFRSLGSGFAKYFARTRLIPGVYRVRRKSTKRASTPRGGISIGKKAGLAGFSAKLTGTKRLADKRMVLQARNPALVIREKGGVIHPRRGQWLFIRGEGFRGRGAQERQARFVKHQVARYGKKKHDRPIVAKVRQVTVKANLRFSRTWRAFAGQRHGIFEKALSEVVRRVARLRSRRAA